MLSPAVTDRPAPGARAALALLLTINLFNYIDRQVLSAVLPKLEIDASMFSPSDPNLGAKLGALTTAFMLSYMLLSPVFGWIGERRSRWMVIGGAVILWSLASGGSGLAPSFIVLLLTRCLVGVGEAAYGPIAPAMLSDMYPQSLRGKIMSYFYLAIPVGSALGFVIGGQIADTAWGWRGAFLAVMVPGLVLGAIALLMTERRLPRDKAADRFSYVEVVRKVMRVPSYLINTLSYTAITFVLGGVAAWIPSFIFGLEARFQVTPEAVARIEGMRASDNVTPLVPPDVVAKLRDLQGDTVLNVEGLKTALASKLSDDEIKQYNSRIFDGLVTRESPTTGSIGLTFGLILVVGGFLATLFGGWLGDRLRDRWSGAYFTVSGVAALLSVPFFIGMLYAPFPYAWICVFLAVFGLFVNTGPCNTILANVVPAEMRANAFAINIFVIHALGDAISPLLIGKVRDLISLRAGFLMCTVLIVVGGVGWCLGARYLKNDTERADELLK